jgi:hypothetical protein
MPHIILPSAQIPGLVIYYLVYLTNQFQDSKAALYWNNFMQYFCRQITESFVLTFCIIENINKEMRQEFLISSSFMRFTRYF